MKRIFIFVLLWSIPAWAFCQVPFKWDFDCALGITSYQGDLDALKVNAGFREIKYSASVSLRRNLSNHLTLRFNLLAGQLAGDDRNFAEPEWRIRRGIAFKSPLIEGTMLSEFYPLGMYPSKGKFMRARNAFSPYLMIGVGWGFTNPEVDWNDANGNEEINPELSDLDKKAKLKKLNVVVPMGVGVRFKLKDHSTFKLEGMLRPTFSDYVDGISLAGNPDKKDWYFTAQIGVTYPFGKNKQKRVNVLAKEEERLRKEEEKAQKEAARAEREAEKERKAEEKRNAKELASDIDKDGTPDLKDDCPTEPGPRDLKGCPDRDKDGVADKSDSCPDEPGTVELSGCPDKDGDGVADINDDCPDEPGPVSNYGCPASDQDGDGIADSEDRCPDQAGPVAFGGCPDTDKDGVPDPDDGCPDVPGKVAMKGCPDLPPPDKAIYFGISRNDWFVTSEETLEETIEIMKKDKSLYASIEGHTDSASEGNETGLSEQRARNVRDYLISQGIPAARLDSKGFGSSRPIGQKMMSDDPQLNRQLNRRVEIRFFRK
ncbi:MAG: DUF6089 family protein [Saprospiraceae bacterium]|nr:OmpA family protein [Saprospiraceae bacterium]